MPKARFFAWIGVAALIGGCSIDQAGFSNPQEEPSTTVPDPFEVRILDSISKPTQLVRFQREPTGLFFPSGFEVDFYDPTLSGASDECQAIADAHYLVVHAGGEPERVKNAVHPTFRSFSDIYGYQYVLENYPDWDFERDGIIPEDYSDLRVYLALLAYETPEGPKQFVNLLSDYAEACDLSQSEGSRTNIEPDNEVTYFRIYNYLGLEIEESGDAGNFYFTWQESTRARSSKFPTSSPSEAYFGVDGLLGSYSGNVLFLAYYDFWEKDSTNLGITREDIDSAIESALTELNALLS